MALNAGELGILCSVTSGTNGLHFAAGYQPFVHFLHLEYGFVPGQESFIP